MLVTNAVPVPPARLVGLPDEYFVTCLEGDVGGGGFFTGEFLLVILGPRSFGCISCLGFFCLLCLLFLLRLFSILAIFSILHLLSLILLLKCLLNLFLYFLPLPTHSFLLLHTHSFLPPLCFCYSLSFCLLLLWIEKLIREVRHSLRYKHSPIVIT